MESRSRFRPYVVVRRRSFALGAALLLTSCAGQPYQPWADNIDSFRGRALSETRGGIRVSTAVPSAEESKLLFGLDLYGKQVQPVWIEVQNDTDEYLRFAPTSVDREYFSPFEVAYVNRAGFSKQAREAMNQTFDEAAMERWIPPRATRSGFVFTHLRPGTKGFNVDVFGDAGHDYYFTFFVDVPGMVPDHSEMDFDALYSEEERRRLDLDGLRRAIEELPCCTTDASGETEREPTNLVLLGEGWDVLHSLLRAGWVETQRQSEAARSNAPHLFGRPPDATFRMQRSSLGERNELNLWLTPMSLGENEVWLAQINHKLGIVSGLGQGQLGARLDPDVDDSRDYMMQLIWYSQGLERYAWSASGKAKPMSETSWRFTDRGYFTDGYRVVLWLSGPLVSLLDVDYVEWDQVPGR